MKPTATATGPIIGNCNSEIYHLPNCPDYNKVLERSRAPFTTEAEVQAGGYWKARNCHDESLKVTTPPAKAGGFS